MLATSSIHAGRENHDRTVSEGSSRRTLLSIDVSGRLGFRGPGDAPYDAPPAGSDPWSCGALADLRTTALLSIFWIVVGGGLGLLAVDRTTAWIERASVEGEPSVLVKDWQLGWSNRPGYRSDRVQLDSRGLRNAEIPASAPADEVRILCLGASRVHGSGVSDAEVFTQVLEDDLPRVRVLNAGVNSYSALQCCQRAMLLMPEVQPDLILLFLSPSWSFRPNELAGQWRRVGDRLVPADVLDRWPPFLHGAGSAFHRLLSHSHLYARYRAARLRGGDVADEVSHFVLSRSPPPAMEGDLRDVADALATLHDTATAAGVEVRAVLLPEQFQISPTAWERYLRDHAGAGAPPPGTSAREPLIVLNEMVERAGIRSWTFFEEVATFLTDIPRYYQEDKAHWTPEGHVRIAATLASYLRQDGLLDDLARRRAAAPR